MLHFTTRKISTCCILNLHSSTGFKHCIAFWVGSKNAKFGILHLWACQWENGILGREQQFKPLMLCKSPGSGNLGSSGVLTESSDPAS